MYSSNETTNGVIIKLSKLRPDERPREKLKAKGAGFLNDIELLAILVGSGNSKNDVFSLAQKIRHIVDTVPVEKLYKELIKIRGIGPGKASAICSALEFARRRYKPSTKKIGKPDDLFAWLRSYAEKKQEHFIVFTLNGANEIISRRVVTVGLLNSTQIHPREVFADAIAERAASLILAHNHPSGITTPSNEDIKLTDKLRRAGNLLGMPILDHIVFSHSGYFSMVDHGLFIELDIDLMRAAGID